MSLRDIAHALFRHKGKVALVMLASLALGAALAARPPQYRAQAVLVAGRPDEARAIAALIEGAELRAEVLSRLGPRLYGGIAADARAAAFAAALAVEAGDGGLVRLRFDDRDPALAVLAIEQLLAAAEARTQAVDPAAEREALAVRRGRVDGTRAAAEAEAAAAAGTADLLRRRLAAMPATIPLSRESGRSRVVEEARAKLFELETREQELLGKFTEESVFVTRVRAERRKVESLLSDLMAAGEARVVEGANPVRQEMETELVRAEAAAATAAGRAQALAAELAAIDARLRAKADPAGRAVPMTGFGIVQAAFAPPRPLGAAPAVVMALALGGGLAVALAMALLAQRLSSRFATPAEVERGLGLPVLTTIPRES